MITTELFLVDQRQLFYEQAMEKLSKSEMVITLDIKIQQISCK